MQQKDAATVVLNDVLNLQVDISSVTDPNTNTTSYYGSNLINIWERLRIHPFFSNYSGMYDQMHLDGVKVRLLGAVQANNSNQYLTPTVVTAWDRNGLDANGAGNVPQPTYPEISTYSSCFSKSWSLGNAFVQNRSLYPSIMSEKSQYVSPLSLVDPSPTNTSVLNSPERNPANGARSPSIPFKPQFLVGVTTPTALLGTTTTFQFNAELDIQVTFRGLRKGPAQA